MGPGGGSDDKKDESSGGSIGDYFARGMAFMFGSIANTFASFGEAVSPMGFKQSYTENLEAGVNFAMLLSMPMEMAGELSEGKAITSEGKGLAKTIQGEEKAIVIGEGMYRVKPAARSVGAKWYQAWSKNFPNGRLMTETELNAAKARNARWLNSKINQGYKIYDIGPIGPIIRSPFYQLERNLIQQRGYPITPLKGF